MTGRPANNTAVPPITTTTALPPAWPDRAAWGTAPLLRAWQTAAMEKYLAASPRDFLAVATPGAGKTTFALTVAAELLGRRIVDRITIVAPTEHLKVQWAEAAARAGIPIDPNYSAGQGRTSQDYLGVAVTYAGVAVNPLAHRIRTERFKTLVILDEVHHAGDALSWGEGVREAFDPATRRLSLTGTPFRSDINPIPFVTYAPGDDGVPRSVADYTYGYAQALADHVVRPVLFLAYSGEMQWRTRAGDEVAARLGEPLTKDLTAQALRTALDPAGSWMPSVLEAADTRLTEVRRHVPDAGGLVIASDQSSARAYAKLLKAISGESPTVVLSDEKAASKKIAAFPESEARWMVAVRMVSEGVDVPRLAVGVYATSISTPLFFAQAVGRFVRARKRGETASVFLPSVPNLLGHASEMEVERDHVLGRKVNDEGDIFAAEQELIDRANESESASGELEFSYEALGSSATFDRVLYDGGEFGHSGEVHVGSEEEMDFLGIPGLLEPDQVRDLLQSRQSERAQKQAQTQARQQKAGVREPDTVAQVSTHEQLAVLRRELNGLVAAWYHRSSQPHGVTHAALRKECGGPAAAWPPRSSSRRGSTVSASGPHASPPRPLLGAVDTLDGMASETSQTLDRGLHVLRVLSGTPGGLTITELSAVLGVNRTVVYRLVSTLEQHALVRRDAASRLHVGLGVLHLASAVQPVLRDQALPVLRRLAEEVGCTAHLTVADGDEALALAVVEPSWTDFHVAYRVGARHPVTQGAAGKAILLGRERNGAAYAVTTGELQAGARGLAAPVRGVDGLEASVGIVTLGELVEAEVGPQVAAAAAAVAARLA